MNVLQKSELRGLVNKLKLSLKPSQSEKDATHSLLDLSFVGFDLAVEFVNDLLEPLLVLVVFLRLERQFLEAPVRLTQVLLGLCVTSLLIVKLVLQLTNLENKTNKSIFSAFFI